MIVRKNLLFAKHVAKHVFWPFLLSVGNLPHCTLPLIFILSNHTIPMKKFCVLNSLSPFEHTQVIIDFICFGFVRWEGVNNKQILICSSNQGSLLIIPIQSAIRYRQTLDHSQAGTEIFFLFEGKQNKS